MKKIYTLLILAGMLFSFSMVSAQELRIVTIPGWDPASGEDIGQYIDAIRIALDADAPLRDDNPNVIYELERGKIYPMAARISPDFDLHIRAEDGDGPLPVMQNWPRADGSYQDIFRTQQNFTLEYVHVDGYDQDGGVGNRNLKHYGEGNRIIYRGCIIDGDRGAAIALYDNDMKLYVYDCVVGNQGHRSTIGGNGRLLDIRPTETQDTIVVQNTTVYNFSDRIIRNMGTVVNYVEVDHLTAFNIMGFHGTLQLGKARNAIVTNSLFANSQLFGDHPFNVEQLHPEGTFFVVALDSIYEGGTYEVRNNNIFWDQEILDVWAAVDSVDVPGLVNPTMLTAAGTTIEEAVFSENLSFDNVCVPPVDFIAAYFADPDASDFPENWCVGGDGGIFPDEIDVAYSSSSESYTAADRNFPVGDLNAFPTLKELWEAGGTVSVGSIADIQPIMAYPNPVRDVLYLNVEANEIAIYNIQGQVVQQAQNVQSMNVSGLSNGIYLLRVVKQNEISTQKIMINR